MKLKALLALLVAMGWSTVTYAQEGDLCLQSDQEQQDTCEMQAIEQCRQANPACVAHSVTISQGVTRTLNDCCKRGPVRFAFCKTKKARAVRHLRRVYPAQFTREAVKAIKALRFPDCSENQQ